MSCHYIALINVSSYVHVFCLFRGVILMRLEHTGKIQSASLISATESEAEEDETVPAVLDAAVV